MSTETPAPSTPTSKLAIWSLVTSLIGLVYLASVFAAGNSAIAVFFYFGFLGLSSVVGVILGHIALKRIKSTGSKGRGLAIAGLVTGYLPVAFWASILVGQLVILIFFYGGGGFN
jgi:hypothetical protein